MLDELSEWKGRALFLEQSVKGLEQENKELRHELGRTKNQMMQWQKDCEEACRQRDREVNRRRTIQQFEEEERRAQAIASAALADPVPLTADEHGHAALMKRISQLPMRRISVSAVQHHHHHHGSATPGAAVISSATVASSNSPTTPLTTGDAERAVQLQQQGHTFPTALSVFGEYTPTSRRRQYSFHRRVGPLTTSSNKRLRCNQSNSNSMSNT